MSFQSFLLSLLAFLAWCPLRLTSVHRQSKVSFLPFFRFFIASSSPVSALKLLLLLLSGQCPNPGPVAYPCPICRLPYSGRGAYRCSLCEGWVHRGCSDLRRRSDWHPLWRCSACVPPPPPPSPSASSSSSGCFYPSVHADLLSCLVTPAYFTLSFSCPFRGCHSAIQLQWHPKLPPRNIIPSAL